MKKHFLIINQAAGSPYHGMVFRSYYIARELINQGHQATIISGSYCHNFYHQPQVQGAFTEENIDGIRYFWIKIPPYGTSRSWERILGMFIFVFRLLFFSLKKLGPMDYIIVSSPPPMPILIGWWWAKRLHAKLFFEVRDIWPLSIQKLGSLSDRHPLVLFFGWIEKFAYQKSDKVISVLAKFNLHLRELNISEDKFVFSPNGIDDSEKLSSAEKTETYVRIVQCKAQGKFVVGYAGTIGVANDLEKLLAAATVLRSEKRIHFVIIGDGPLRESLKNIIAEKGHSNVSVLPAVKKNEIHDVLMQFDVAYLGLKNEDVFKFGISPNKLYDYMLAERPIVMAINAGNDIVGDAHCGRTIADGDPARISEAILELMAMSDEQRATLGKNGHRFVMENHTYSHIARRLVNDLGLQK